LINTRRDEPASKSSGYRSPDYSLYTARPENWAAIQAPRQKVNDRCLATLPLERLEGMPRLTMGETCARAERR